MSGEAIGPITWDGMLQASRSTSSAPPINNESWVFMEGMAEWLPADEIVGLLPPPATTTAMPAAPAVTEAPQEEPVEEAPPPPPPPPSEDSFTSISLKEPPSPSKRGGGLGGGVPRGSVTRDSFACFVPRLPPQVEEDEEGEEGSGQRENAAAAANVDSHGNLAAGEKRPSVIARAAMRASQAGAIATAVPASLRQSLSAAPGLSTHVSSATISKAATVDDPDQISQMLSPHVHRSKRRKESIKRKSSIGTPTSTNNAGPHQPGW